MARISSRMENMDPSALVLSVPMNRVEAGRTLGSFNLLLEPEISGSKATPRSRTISDASANGLRSVLCFSDGSEIYLRDHGLPGLRCDEVDCFGDVIGLEHVQEGRVPFGSSLSEREIRVNAPRTDQAYLDVVRLQLSVQRLHHPHLGVFRRAVHRLVRISNDPGYRGDGYDLAIAAFDHQRDNEPCKQKSAAIVDRDHLVIIVDRGGDQRFV